MYEQWIEQLNAGEKSVRLAAIQYLKNAIDCGEIKRVEKTLFVNNHIHTTYSFSPYSPTKAVWMAYNAGLQTAGIMDHDAIDGAEEFVEAGRIIGLATTIGVELRVDFSDTGLSGKRINNPDQKGIAYVAVHGIPHTQIQKVRAFFKPYMEARNKRNLLMTEKINAILEPFKMTLDYDKDVVPISCKHDGGSITERHLLYALALKLIEIIGQGEPLIRFIQETLHMNISAKVQEWLMDMNNPHYVYDLLGVLKSDLVGRIYIDADEECPSVEKVIDFVNEIGAISAYAYLGDVGDSVTGDKKTQKFEDDYLEDLFNELSKRGFHAVTYMPSRNSTKQLERLQGLCVAHQMFQISGEDINSPRQSFICKALENPINSHLIQATWALIGHEKAATTVLNNGMFSPETIRAMPLLEDRTKAFAQIGKAD